MRPFHIACVSDLHIEHKENREIVAAMAQELIEWGPDLLILAGDLASTPKRVAQVLGAFQNLAQWVVFIPGNHDLWYPFKDASRLNTFNSWDVYKKALPETAKLFNIHYLPAAPLVLPQLTLVGTMGWYDYGFASPLARTFYNQGDFERKRAGQIAWTDGQWLRFRDENGRRMHDAEVAECLAQDLKAQLQSITDQTQPILAVTHTLPFRQLMSGHGGFAKDYFTAFMGHQGLGDMLLADGRVKWAIHGHSHQAHAKVVDGIKVWASPLGTPREHQGASKADLLQKRVLKLELRGDELIQLNG